MQLTKADRQKIRNCEWPLQAVILEAAKTCPIPFKVQETLRTKEQQRINIKKHVSWTMNSKHLPDKNGLARAADLVPIDDNGKPIWSWQPYLKMRPYIQKAADKVKVRVRWGGTWKEGVSFPLHRKADGPHWELMP